MPNVVNAAKVVAYFAGHFLNYPERRERVNNRVTSNIHWNYGGLMRHKAAINAFLEASRIGQRAHTFQQSSNGGLGGPGGENLWLSTDDLQEILAEQWDHVSWDGEILQLGRTPFGIHQHHQISWQTYPGSSRKLAIDAFLRAGQPDELPHTFRHSPNGGMGGPEGQNLWLSTDALDEILEEDWDDVSWDGEILRLSRTPFGVHQHHEIDWQPSPIWSRRIVAYCGQGCGWEWGFQGLEGGAEAYELAEEFQTDALAEALTDDPESCGCEAIEDCLYNDDGTFYAIVDESKLLDMARTFPIE